LVEDFTTYTEADPNSKLTVAASRITFTSLTIGTDVDTCVYIPKTLNAFISTYTLCITTEPSASGLMIGTCVSADNYGDHADPTNEIGVYPYYSTSTPTLYRIGIGGKEGGGGFGATWTSSVFSFGSVYIVKFLKTGAHTEIIVYDVNGDVVDTLVRVFASDITGTYFMPMQSIGTGTGVTVSGYVENLTVDELNLFDEELALRTLPGGELALRTLPNPEVAMRTLPSSELAVKVRK